MRTKKPNRRTIRHILTELYQNSRRAGATRIEVTTSPRDDGGSNISVKDNGSGISDAKALAGGRESTWPSSVMTAERPVGAGLTALWAAGFTIISQTRNGTKWRMTVQPDEKPADAAPKTYKDTETGTGEPGTTIHLSTAVCRNDAGAEAVETARYLQIQTHVDHELVKIRNLLEGAAYTRDVGNVRIGVYDNKPPSANSDLNLAGRLMTAELPEVQTQTETWTARAELLPVPPDARNDLQVAEPWRGTLVPGAAADKLRTDAEQTILMAMAAHETPPTVYTETRARARMLGVDLPQPTPHLTRWTPGADRVLGEPDDHALIITLTETEAKPNERKQ